MQNRNFRMRMIILTSPNICSFSTLLLNIKSPFRLTLIELHSKLALNLVIHPQGKVCEHVIGHCHIIHLFYDVCNKRLALNRHPAKPQLWPDPDPNASTVSS